MSQSQAQEIALQSVIANFFSDAEEKGMSYEDAKAFLSANLNTIADLVKNVALAI